MTYPLAASDAQNEHARHRNHGVALKLGRLGLLLSMMVITASGNAARAVGSVPAPAADVQAKAKPETGPAARRVVTLAPHLAELVCAAGGCDRLVGVSARSDYPASVPNIAQVGDAWAINLEAVLALRPDLVLAWDGGTPVATITRLRRLGLRVEAVKVEGLANIATVIEVLGRRLGTTPVAAAAAAAYRTRLTGQRERHREKPPIRVVYQIETAPAFTINADSPISEALAVCGGVNVFASLATLSAAVGAEAMLAAAPEAVLYGGEENTAAMTAYWARLPTVPATQRKALYPVNADWLARATPRLLDGIDEVCGKLDDARAKRNAALPK